jgi:uncharacterized membrane protein
MTLLIAGLVLFLGVHSLRIFAEGWRRRQIEHRGELTFKGLYSVLSLAGFVLIVWGYAQARVGSLVLWTPPTWTGYLAAVLTLPAFVLLVAAYVPGNRFKSALGHPMVLGVKLWAFAHLLSNGTLADVVLFGAFLLWAILDFRAARLRDRAAGTGYPAGSPARDVLVTVVGVAAWAAFAFWLHGPLIGVAPFAGATA